MAQMQVEDPAESKRKIVTVGKHDFHLDADGKLPVEVLSGKSYGIGTSKSQKGYGDYRISFKVSPKIISALQTAGQQTIRSDENQFNDVLQSFVNLRTKRQSSPFKTPLKITGKTGNTFEHSMNMHQNTVNKYLKLAEIAGIYNPKDFSFTGEDEEIDEEKIKGYEDFLVKKEVQDYMKEWEKHAYDLDTKEGNRVYSFNLFKALKILGLTPYQLSTKSMAQTASNAERIAYVKELLKPLKTWSEDPDAVDPVSNRPRKLHPLKRYNPRGKKYNNATMYQFVKSIRAFMIANGVTLPDQSDESLLSGKTVSHGLHAEQKLYWDQILAMIECLQNPVKEVTIPTIEKYVVDWDKTKTVETSMTGFTYQSFWQDALLYFLIAIEMGMRAEEGFTIIASEPVNKFASGVKEKKKTDDGKAISKDKHGNYKWYISLYTRKTEHLNVEDKIHKGRVKDAALIKMLEQRRSDIDQNKHGAIVKEVQVGKKLMPNTLHSLIGVDNKYTQIQSIDKSKPVKKENRREILRNIIRHCYLKSVAKADRDETFDNFMLMPLHSLRHIFAQYWLHKSGQNFTFVARLGHWKTEKELKDSYGGMDDDTFDEDYEEYSEVDAGLSGKEIKAQLKKPKVMLSKSSTKEINDNYPKTENLIPTEQQPTEPKT